MTILIRHILIAFILISSFVGYSQPPGGQGQRPNIPEVTLKGKVLDGQLNLPLEYATISIYKGRDTSLIDGTVTDVKGEFSLKVKGGLFIIEVSFLGYVAVKLNSINYKNEYNTIDFGDIIINPDAESIEEVEVIAERSEMQLHLDKRVFNVAKDLANQGGDATDILNNIPSVEVDIEGNVSLRGSENVQILIDGKPSGLTGMGNAEALKLLQSDMIERVEIITNPSAKYDAEGDAGIINIILKKEKQKGLNGTFSVHTGYPHNHGLGININYRKKIVNLFAGYNFRYRKNPGFGNLHQESYNGDTTLIFNQRRDHERGGWSNTGRVGIEFSMKKGHSIGFSGLYRYGLNDNEVHITYKDLDYEGNIIELTERHEEEDETRKTGEVSFHYLKQFKKEKHKLKVDAKFISSLDMEQSKMIEIAQQAGTTIQQRSSNEENESLGLIQIDYNLPWAKKGIIEIGAKATLRDIENNYSVEQLDSSEWEVLGLFDDKLNYKENIYAGYLIIGNTWGKFSWQTGVRAEYTDISVISKNFDPDVYKDYLKWFPSAHLSYKFSDKNSIQFSYSYRIRRPYFRYLLPFSSFSDSRNIWGGNPDLNPEYTNSVEIGYLKHWKSGSFLGSIYYQYGTDVIRRVTTVNDAGQSRTFPVNLSTKHSTGFEFSFSQDLFKWWDIRLNANLFWMELLGSYAGENLDSRTIRGNFSLKSSWNLPKDIQIQASYRYLTPYESSQGKIKSRSALSISAAVDVLKGKGTLALTGRDLFNTMKRRSVTEGSNFTRISEFQWRSRQIVLTFSYRLNQKNKKQGGRPEGQGGDFDEF